MNMRDLKIQKMHSMITKAAVRKSKAPNNVFFFLNFITE